MNKTIATADEINTALHRADVEAAESPASLDWLRAELATARARRLAGFDADKAAVDAAEDAFAGFDLSEEAWASMIDGKIEALERGIAKHPKMVSAMAGFRRAGRAMKDRVEALKDQKAREFAELLRDGRETGRHDAIRADYIAALLAWEDAIADDISDDDLVALFRKHA